MARHSSRLLRLVRWQYTRWGLALPTFLFGLWACNSHELQVPKPNPQQETDFSILVSPERKVDLLFMIDNSPSMDPKQKALAENFPKMIEALKNLEGGLPDVHVGVISSDMGAGNAEAGGNCSVVLGNQGILWGNDQTVDPKDRNNKFATVRDIQNGCGMDPGARWLQDILDTDGITRKKNYKGDLAEAFSCLAKAVGTSGCGYEHPLQSVRVALNPIVKTDDPNSVDINPQNVGFLRQKAFLAVVLIADEDDCSADPNPSSNDLMFKPRTLGDTASLRCATRGHICNGADIPDYDPETGYKGDKPFVAKFSDCEAKDIERQPSKDGDPTYKQLPLIRIRDMIDSVNGVKDRPQEQILVSGVIGWPKDDKTEGLEYRIDKDPTSMPDAQKNLWDYMAFCKLPSEKSDDGNIYKAYGSYRLKKFLDAFKDAKKPEETGVYSICDTANFKDAMTRIGNAIVAKLKPGCVDFPLIDANPNLPDVQPECQVKDRMSCDQPGKQVPSITHPDKMVDCLPSGYTEEALPQCIIPDTGKPLNPADVTAAEKKKIPNELRPCWYLVYDSDPNKGCPNSFKNQRITALRKSNANGEDGNAPPGTLLGMQCLTCASPPVDGKSVCPAVGTM